MENELSPWGSIAGLKANRDYWEKRSSLLSQDVDYYRQQLADAHAILGRVVHQASERWDSVRLTKHYPTDNLRGQRTINNPSGEAL